MNKRELYLRLEENKIPKDAYSLAGGFPNECFCMEKWEVYYSERGVKTQLLKFETENEACEYMYQKLLAILKKE